MLSKSDVLFLCARHGARSQKVWSSIIYSILYAVFHPRVIFEKTTFATIVNKTVPRNCQQATQFEENVFERCNDRYGDHFIIRLY